MKPLLSFALLLALTCFSSLAAADADTLLPRPPELASAVQFWIRVYTEVSTDAGFIHDQRDLSVVYETLHFDPDTPPREREHRVNAERERFHDILIRLASGAAPASAEEQRVRALWAEQGTPLRLREAADEVRFQLGQSDRFRAGLVRAGAWDDHIAEVLARMGLPPELAALPHVESSFNPAAYSKVGAAGLWQFLRSTGRRFLRIDSAVDERLDPFRETEAAAQLLAYNYRLLGSWPLAITAYNHGAEGMLRARDQLGTDDIVRIVRDYHSPSFGFASRNFYVSFLAALTVSQDPEKYFGKLQRSPEIEFHELRMPASANIAALAYTVGVDRATLLRLNPALRPAVWNGRRPIPAGYVLRLPASDSGWNTQLLARQLSGAHAVSVAQAPAVGSAATTNAAPLALAAATTNVMLAANAAPTFATPAGAPVASVMGAGPTASWSYLVRSQDTVSSIADRTGVPLGQLMALNSMPDQDHIYEGEQLRLVAGAPEPDTAATPASAALAQQAVRESSEEQQAVVLASHLDATAQPVSAAQAQAVGPELVPGVAGPQSVDPVDYSVAADGSIRVVAAETLGHYADWLGTTASRLRAINHLRGRTPVVMGRRLTLEFNTITREQFEQRRREYHQGLQAAYFASHRIHGTEVYVARRGDSLWNITKRNLRIPVWLLQQYNPDLDFSNLRPGTQVSLPQVEQVAAL